MCWSCVLCVHYTLSAYLWVKLDLPLLPFCGWTLGSWDILWVQLWHQMPVEVLWSHLKLISLLLSHQVVTHTLRWIPGQPLQSDIFSEMLISCISDMVGGVRRLCLGKFASWYVICTCPSLQWLFFRPLADTCPVYDCLRLISMDFNGSCIEDKV